MSEVQIKPLEWRNNGSEEYAIRWDAKSPAGISYVARAVRPGDMVLCDGRYHHNIEAAKAAAQADYEQRIRSAILPAALSGMAEPSGYAYEVFRSGCDWQSGGQYAYWEADASLKVPSGAQVRNVVPLFATPPVSDLREENETFQSRLTKAHVALFHDDPTDVPERRARFFEESNETCQALGMTREEAHALVDYTYDRPAGDPAKEIGASFLTLASVCVVAGYDLEACGEADLEKLQRPETIHRIRAKRATRHGRGPLPGVDPEGK